MACFCCARSFSIKVVCHKLCPCKPHSIGASRRALRLPHVRPPHRPAWLFLKVNNSANIMTTVIKHIHVTSQQSMNIQRLLKIRYYGIKRSERWGEVRRMIMRTGNTLINWKFDSWGWAGLARDSCGCRGKYSWRWCALFSLWFKDKRRPPFLSYEKWG